MSGLLTERHVSRVQSDTACASLLFTAEWCSLMGPTFVSVLVEEMDTEAASTFREMPAQVLYGHVRISLRGELLGHTITV